MSRQQQNSISSGIRWSVVRPVPIDRSRHLTIGEVARRFDMTLRALRFYESKGLLRPLRDGQTRFYAPRDLVRVELILKGKQLGFTLTEITAMLDERPDGPVSELRLSRERLLEQIDHLETQHRDIERALTELRRRYYLMADVDMR